MPVTETPPLVVSCRGSNSINTLLTLLDSCETFLPSTGIINSLNYPDEYPHNFYDETTINAIDNCLSKLGFSHFAVYTDQKCGDCVDKKCGEYLHKNFTGTCLCDYMEITDGSGSTLMDRSCGYANVHTNSPVFFQPPVITTNSSITVSFKTDGNGTKGGGGRDSPIGGWRAVWASVTPGATQKFVQLKTSNPNICPTKTQKFFQLKTRNLRVQPCLPWHPLQEHWREKLPVRSERPLLLRSLLRMAKAQMCPGFDHWDRSLAGGLNLPCQRLCQQG